MKKKIMSTLLAVAMFVTVLVPALSAALVSDVAGDAKKVTKIVADKATYEIAPNGDPIDFSTKISVFETESKLVLDKQHIRYDLEGIFGDYNDFKIDGSKVWCRTEGAKARLTIYDNYNKNARVSVEIVGKGAAGKAKAETATFSSFNYELPYTTGKTTGIGSTGNSEDVTLKLEAHPKGTAFQADDVAVIENYVVSRLELALGLRDDDANFKGANSGIKVETKGNQELKVSTLVIDLKDLATLTTANTAPDTLSIASQTLTADMAAPTVPTVGDTAAKIAARFAGKTVIIGGVTYTASVSGTVVTLTGDKAAPTVLPVIATFTAGTTGAPSNAITPAVTADAGKESVSAVITYSNITTADLPAGALVEFLGGRYVAIGTLATDLPAIKAAADASGKVPTNWTLAATSDGFTLTANSDAVALIGTPSIVVNGKVLGSSTGDWTGIAPKVLVNNTKIDGNNSFMNITIPAAVLDRMQGNVEVNKAILFSADGIKRLDDKTDKFSVSTNLMPVPAIRATGIALANEYNVKVGEKTAADVTYFPQNANVGRKVSYRVNRWFGDNKPYQYAIMDGDKILGVNATNVAKARLETRLDGTTRNKVDGNYTYVSNINVAPYNFDGTVTPQTAIVLPSEMTVGGVFDAKVINIPRGVEVKSWSYVSNVDGIIDFTAWSGAETKVVAKKVGTAKIAVELTNGEKYTSADVVVKAAPAVEEKPTTSNPQTGDSWFANLFF